jgi:hypothetical protein
MPYYAVDPALLQFRRQRAVKHFALRTLKQIERVGLDRQRPAHALQLRDPFDPRKTLFQIRPAAGPGLVDIEQLAGQQAGSGSGMLTQRIRCVGCTTQVPFGR